MTPPEHEPPPSTQKMTKKDPQIQAKQHLQKALATTDCAEKQYHIRAALQLLTIEDR